jgi:hypothetical protein
MGLRHAPAIPDTPTAVDGRGVTHLTYRVRREG